MRTGVRRDGHPGRVFSTAELAYVARSSRSRFHSDDPYPEVRDGMVYPSLPLRSSHMPSVRWLIMRSTGLLTVRLVDLEHIAGHFPWRPWVCRRTPRVGGRGVATLSRPMVALGAPESSEGHLGHKANPRSITESVRMVRNVSSKALLCGAGINGTGVANALSWEPWLLVRFRGSRAR